MFVHDPQIPLQMALYVALAEMPLVVSGQTIPVYEFAPSAAQPPYLLLSQQTVNPQAGSARCRVWMCTWLLDVVTSFSSKNQISSRLSALITEQILARLEGQRLPLTDGFQMSPIELMGTSMLTDNPSQETTDVHRYIRLRASVEQHLSQ